MYEPFFPIPHNLLLSPWTLGFELTALAGQYWLGVSIILKNYIPFIECMCVFLHGTHVEVRVIPLSPSTI